MSEEELLEMIEHHLTITTESKYLVPGVHTTDVVLRLRGREISRATVGNFE
jgi:hypothetical protein